MRPAKVKLMKNYRLYGFPRLQTTQYQKENTDKNIKSQVFLKSISCPASQKRGEICNLFCRKCVLPQLIGGN